jgi:hypothetical protein
VALQESSANAGADDTQDWPSTRLAWPVPLDDENVDGDAGDGDLPDRRLLGGRHT